MVVTLHIFVSVIAFLICHSHLWVVYFDDDNVADVYEVIVSTDAVWFQQRVPVTLMLLTSE